MATAPPGFDSLQQYPVLDAIFRRRSRRISKGMGSVPAGSLSYTSAAEPQPLTPLEEAILIAATGTTGVTMPDRPFENDAGEKILGSPNLHMAGRTAGSPDNAQAAHFFLINDTGTYFLRRIESPPAKAPMSADELIRRAEESKQLVLDHRLDFPRDFPYYFDSNRFVSNLPGSTILVPVVDTTPQYINGLMYLLTQPDGFRPTFVDDRNFYRTAGVKKWVKNGFLNPKIKIPLTMAGTFRTDIESDLICQNLVLTMQAMGLGGWIHASFAGNYLLGHPMFREHGSGLGFRWEVPRFSLLDLVRWGTFLPKVRANPVGLDGVLEGMCPPYHESMAAAVDVLVASKYGPGGTYVDPAPFEAAFKPGLTERYLKEVPRYREEAIACAKDVCDYIWRTHRRFPAHCNAIHVPGVWVQAHHLDLGYYDTLFRSGYSESHRQHQDAWHPESARAAASETPTTVTTVTTVTTEGG